MSHQQLFVLFLTIAALVSGYLVYTYLKFKHKERREMIQRGDLVYDQGDFLGLKYSVLSKAVVFLSLAVGLGIGYTTTVNGRMPDPVVVYAISIFACLGIGLFLYYLFIQKAGK